MNFRFQPTGRSSTQFPLTGDREEGDSCGVWSNVEAGDYILNELKQVDPFWTRFSSTTDTSVNEENNVQLL